MARIKLRIELPRDLPVSDEQVRAAVLSGLHDLHKSESARQHRSRYLQALIDKSTDIYETQMRAMIEEIKDVLSR